MTKVNRLAIAFLAVLTIACLTLTGARALAGQSTGVVNVNTANASQIALLPGIGIAKARAIIAYREKKSFKTVDDLLAVKGIGKTLLSKMRARVVTSGKTTIKSTAKASKSKKSRKSNKG